MDIVAYQGPVTGYGRTDTYDWERLGSSRAIAHSELGELGANLVRPELRSRALEIFSAWRRRSRHILGVHMRGTDKVVRRKVAPPLLTMAMLTMAILTMAILAIAILAIALLTMAILTMAILTMATCSARSFLEAGGLRASSAATSGASHL